MTVVMQANLFLELTHISYFLGIHFFLVIFELTDLLGSTNDWTGVLGVLFGQYPTAAGVFSIWVFVWGCPQELLFLESLFPPLRKGIEKKKKSIHEMQQQRVLDTNHCEAVRSCHGAFWGFQTFTARAVSLTGQSYTAVQLPELAFQQRNILYGHCKW